LGFLGKVAIRIFDFCASAHVYGLLIENALKFGEGFWGSRDTSRSEGSCGLEKKSAISYLFVMAAVPKDTPQSQ